jgi:hypothetical protein
MNAIKISPFRSLVNITAGMRNLFVLAFAVIANTGFLSIDDLRPLTAPARVTGSSDFSARDNALKRQRMEYIEISAYLI